MAFTGWHDGDVWTNITDAAPPDAAWWLEESNARYDDSKSAHCAFQELVNISQTSNALQGWGYNIIVPPSAAITGIAMKVKRFQSTVNGRGDANGEGVRTQSVALVIGGMIRSDSKSGDGTANNFWPSNLVDHEIIYGGEGDTWGVDPSYLVHWRFAADNFGASLVAEVNGYDIFDAYTGFVTHIAIGVYYSATYDHPMRDGVLLNGAAFAIRDPFRMHGGNLGGGNAKQTFTDQFESAGGAGLAGLAALSFSYVVGQGSSIIGGTADVKFTGPIRSEGGITAAGSAPFYGIDFIEGLAGGLFVGGDAENVHSYQPVGDAVKVTGEWVELLAKVMVGGAKFPPTEVIPYGTTNEPPNGVAQGGVRLNGPFFVPAAGIGVIYVDTPNPAINFVPASADAAVDSVRYHASGGVELIDTLNPTITGYRFNVTLELLWQVRTVVVRDLKFYWNTGQLTMFWYRIIADGPVIDDCEPQICCKKTIVNVHARTVAELCEKLSERKFGLSIQSVSKFKNPATLGNALVDWQTQEALSADYLLDNEDCIDVIDICEVPQCADFCIDVDLRVTFSMNMTQQANAFHVHEAGDGTVADRSIFVAGAAPVILVRFIPDFPFESGDGTASDRSVFVEGESFLQKENYTMKGGSLLDGTASSAFSHWEYVGGVWPFYMSDTYAQVIESVGSLYDEEGEEVTGTRPWQNLNEAQLPDSFYAQTDISYSGESEFLVFRKFRLNLPQDAIVVRIQVSIDRWTSQIGAEDTYFLLVHGNDIVSNNLEQTGFRWPLLPTMITYGDPSSRFEPNQLRFKGQHDIEDDPWDTDMLNSDEFGVAIQVKDEQNLANTIAYIDYISMEVQYDFPPHQHIQLAGDAGVVASHYEVVSDGDVDVGGAASLYVHRNYTPTGFGVATTAVVMGGSYTRSIFYESDTGELVVPFILGGGVALGGESLVFGTAGRLMFEAGDGGSSVSGNTRETGPFYEFVTGGLSVGGAAIHTNTQPEGGALIDGSAVVRSHPITIIVSGGITLNGGIEQPLSLGGSALAEVNHLYTRGGMSAGGSSIVKPYWDVAKGGGSLAGGAMQRFDYQLYEASGEVELGGGADALEATFTYVASGQVELDGSADRRFVKSVWDWVSDGNAIFAFGEAGIKAGNLGTQSVSFGSDGMEIILFTGIFSEDIDEGDLVGLSETVSQCDCVTLPLVIEMEHNMVRDNIFAKFLVRNNFTISRSLELRHNEVNNSWQSNLHYRGLSADANTEEKWDLVFELQCTSDIGSIYIGRTIWKLAISVKRENLTTMEDFDTRIIIGLMPETICGFNVNELDFTVTFDTQLDLASVRPDAVIYQTTLFDNIGLFKNQSWINNPDLILTVTQSGLRDQQTNVDVVDLVLLQSDAEPIPSS